MKNCSRMILYVSIACLFLLSCGRERPEYKQRSSKMLRQLVIVDSSLIFTSPSPKLVIEKYLRQATDSTDYYEFLSRMCRYYINSSTPDSTLYYIDRTFAYLQRQPSNPRINSILSYIYASKASYYHLFHKNDHEVIRLMTKSYQLAMQGCDVEGLPGSCANIGDAYSSINDMPHAAYWYRRSLFLVDSLKLPAVQNATLYTGLAQIYLNLGDYNSALKCYLKANDYYGLMPIATKICFVNNFGTFYYYQKDYKHALQKYLQMKKLLVDAGLQNVYSMYLCKLDLADVYLNLDDTLKAQSCLDEAERFFSESKDEVALYYCHTVRLGLALRRNDLMAASNILHQEKINATMDQGLVSIRQRYLQEYYLKMKDYRRAFYCLKNHVTWNDSLEQNRMHMMASDIMMRFSADTLSLHHQIAMQRKDAEVHKDRTLIIVSISISAVLFLVAMLGFIYSRKHNLQMRFDIMKLRLDNARNRISPHFVFNVLNSKIVNADKKESDQLVTLAKLIRESLTLSTKSYISIREELDFIRYYIEVQRSMIGGHLHYSVEVSDDVDIDTVLVPSMFIQILVENSIKHAFTDEMTDKEIHVAIGRTDGVVVISVTDNGTGFDIRKSNFGSTKTGLSVIRNTIHLINQRNVHKMNFDIQNMTDDGGRITGCKSVLTIDNI